MKLWKFYRHDAEPGAGPSDPPVPPPAVETPPALDATPAPQDVAPDPAPEPAPEPPDDGDDPNATPDQRANSRLAKERDGWRIKYERLDATRAALDAKADENRAPAESVEQERERYNSDPFLWQKEENRRRDNDTRVVRAADKMAASPEAKADEKFWDRIDGIVKDHDLNSSNPERDAHHAMLIYREKFPKTAATRGPAIPKGALKGGKGGGTGQPVDATLPSEAQMEAWLKEGPEGVEKYRQARRRMGFSDRL